MMINRRYCCDRLTDTCWRNASEAITVAAVSWWRYLATAAWSAANATATTWRSPSLSSSSPTSPTPSSSCFCSNTGSASTTLGSAFGRSIAPCVVTPGTSATAFLASPSVLFRSYIHTIHTQWRIQRGASRLRPTPLGDWLTPPLTVILVCDKGTVLWRHHRQFISSNT